MTDYSRNPISERVIHASRGPGPRASRWIGWGLGGLAGVLLVVLMARAPSPRIGSVAAGLAPALETVLLALCFVLATAMMAAYRRGEDYGLLRLTHLTAGQIVYGYSDGIQYRLRIVRAAAVGLPAGWALAGLFLVGSYSFSLAAVFAALCMTVLAGLGVAVVLAARAVLTSLTERIVEVGIWLALRRGRSAETLAITTGLAAFALLVVVMALDLEVMIPLVCLPALWLGVFVTLDRYQSYFERDAIKAVEAELRGDGLE